jgi:2,5-furandicarboxylate decarboxylase 1
VQSGMRAMPIDPSIGPERTWSKAGFDLTLPFLRPGETRRIDHRLAEPPTYSSAGLQPAKTVEQALAQGALYFEQLMALLGSRDGREIVLALDALRQTGRLVRDEEGRYALPAKQGKQ